MAHALLDDPRARSRIRRLGPLALVVLVAGLTGCGADGTSNGNVTFEHDGVPFTFEHPAGFTDERVDGANSRGKVVAVRALDKVDVLAVRRLPVDAGRTVTRLRVLGKEVTSRVYPVRARPGWGLECQYTSARSDAVMDACREALRTLTVR